MLSPVDTERAMPSDPTDDLRAKVDAFLRSALAEPDPNVRAKLLGKAVHWTNMAKKAPAGLRAA